MRRSTDLLSKLRNDRGLMLVLRLLKLLVKGQILSRLTLATQPTRCFPIRTNTRMVLCRPTTILLDMTHMGTTCSICPKDGPCTHPQACQRHHKLPWMTTRLAQSGPTLKLLKQGQIKYKRPIDKDPKWTHCKA